MYSVKNRVNAIVQKETEAILNIPKSNAYEAAVELIHLHIHKNGGKLITSGMGKAGQIAHNIATTFSSTGTPAAFLHPSESQHGDLGILQKNDILLVVSNSGKTREIIELIELSKQLIPNIPYILISGNETASLSKDANYTLLTGGPEEVCPLGLSPTTSITCMTVIGDIIVVLMMDKIGFNKAEYSKRHHGGYLGQKSRS